MVTDERIGEGAEAVNPADPDCRCGHSRSDHALQRGGPLALPTGEYGRCFGCRCFAFGAPPRSTSPAPAPAGLEEEAERLGTDVAACIEARGLFAGYGFAPINDPRERTRRQDGD